ncbi:MAG: competence protein CoiA family protein [Candidatus Hodarchaeota archaeon]
MSKSLLFESSSSESWQHKAIKYLLYKTISEKDRNVREKSLEKYYNNRRADIYYKLQSGQEIVIEVQNSNISVKEIIKRTEDYNKKGIYVLWILYGEGNCVASTKVPKDEKKIRISTTESFLHKMYGGRVYYVNFNTSRHQLRIGTPFALHFSYPSNKKYKKMVHARYNSYFIRNANSCFIPSWNLLCVKYNGFKIARFYDKSIIRVLKDLIADFIIKKTKKNCTNCRVLFKKKKRCSLNQNCNFKPYKNNKLVKIIIKCFNKKYGKNFILRSILDLIKERKIDLKKDYIIKKLK